MITVTIETAVNTGVPEIHGSCCFVLFFVLLKRLIIYAAQFGQSVADPFRFYTLGLYTIE